MTHEEAVRLLTQIRLGRQDGQDAIQDLADILAWMLDTDKLLELSAPDEPVKGENK